MTPAAPPPPAIPSVPRGLEAQTTTKGLDLDPSAMLPLPQAPLLLPGDLPPPDHPGRDPSVIADQFLHSGVVAPKASLVDLFSDDVADGIMVDTSGLLTPARLADKSLDRPPAEPPPPTHPSDDVSLGNCSDSSQMSIDFDEVKPPPGSLFDSVELERPPSPDVVSDFPFDPTADDHLDSLTADLPQMPTLFDSVARVVCRTRVVGLTYGFDTAVRVLRCSTSAAPKLVDGGSNICLTNDVNILMVSG